MGWIWFKEGGPKFSPKNYKTSLLCTEDMYVQGAKLHRAMAKAKHFADVSVLLEVALYALITSGFKL